MRIFVIVLTVFTLFISTTGLANENPVTKVRVVYRKDGGVSVIYPVLKSRHTKVDIDRIIAEIPNETLQDLVGDLTPEEKIEDILQYAKGHGLEIYHMFAETEEEWLERVFTKAMNGNLKGCEYDDIDKSELPEDRKYRNAWTGKRGEGVSIDPIKKAEIDAQPVYTEEQKKLINEEMRKMVIERLQEKGEL